MDTLSRSVEYVMSLYHQRWHLAGEHVVCSLSPQDNLNPCRGPFTAENCPERGAEAQNSPQQKCSFRKGALTAFPAV